MKPLYRISGAAGILLCALPLLANAAEPLFGQREFQTRCAMCHGKAGRGDGWLAEFLIQRPPTLTQLKNKNGGTFPREQIARVIDGRFAIKSHGPSEMPAWGAVYRAELNTTTGALLGVREEDEVNISYRIQALVEYLATIQE